MRRIAAILVLMLLLLEGCAGHVMTWQEQYDLGIRYLNESNYEEAILAFTQAIEIDPENVDGYLGRAKAYLGVGSEENKDLAVTDFLAAADICVEQGDSERAEEILNEVQQEDPRINDKLSQITGTDSTQQSESRLENEYYDDGTLQVSYEYDEDGNLVKESHYDEDGALQEAYEYNRNGLLTKINYYNPDGTFWKVEEYDENGYLVRQNFYDPDGVFDFYWISEYDENGNAVLKKEYDADGEFTYYYINEYDENGNKRKASGYQADGTLENVFEYDENGNRVD